MATKTLAICWNIYLNFLVLIVVCSSESSKRPDYCLGHFERCICNETVVECHDEKELTGNDIINLYPYIKDHIERFIITGSNFEETQKNFLGSCKDSSDLKLNELKYMDLSNNNIKTVHGKTFHCMPNLETLILTDNQWEIDRKEEQVGYFTSMPYLKHLDLTNSFSDGEDGSIYFYKLGKIFTKTDMTVLETLKLSHNEFIALSEASANSLCQLTNLRELDLSHNLFDKPAMPTKVDCFHKLETLDLSYNNIRFLTEEFTSEIDAVYKKYGHLKNIRLGNNPYTCDCLLQDTWLWLNSTKAPVDKDAMTCGTDNYHSSYTGKAILSLGLDDLLCQEVQVQSHTAVRVVTGIIFSVIGVTLVVFLFVHRDKLRLCIKRWKKRMPASMKFRSHQGYASVQEVATI